MPESKLIASQKRLQFVKKQLAAEKMPERKKRLQKLVSVQEKVISLRQKALLHKAQPSRPQ